jgi:hypothetical protein
MTESITPREDTTVQALCNEVNALQVQCFDAVRNGAVQMRTATPVAVVRDGRIYLSAEANDSALLFFVDGFGGNSTLALTWQMNEWAEKHNGWFRVVWDDKTRPIGMEFVKAEECKNWS